MYVVCIQNSVLLMSLSFLGEKIENKQIVVNKSMPVVTSSHLPQQGHFGFGFTFYNI